MIAQKEKLDSRANANRAENPPRQEQIADSMAPRVDSVKRDVLLTAKRAAELLGVSQARVRQLVRDGRLDSSRSDRGVFVSSASVASFERGRPGPSPRMNCGRGHSLVTMSGGRRECPTCSLLRSQASRARARAVRGAV